MERTKLIQRRDFGDKSNELTDFVLNNFSTLSKWAMCTIVPASVAYALLNIYLPQETVIQWLVQLVSIFVAAVFCAMQTTAVAEHFATDTPLKELKLRPILPQMLKNIGRTVLLLFVPLVLFGIIVFFINNLDTEINRYTYTPSKGQLTIVSLLVASLLSMPLFHILNAIAIEHRSGGDALKRGLRLSIHRFFFTVIYITIIVLLGLILPELATLPLFFFEVIDHFFVTSFEVKDAEVLFNIVEVLLVSVSTLCVMIQVMFTSLAMVFDYGDVVDRLDNITFREKVNNFENL